MFFANQSTHQIRFKMSGKELDEAIQWELDEQTPDTDTAVHIATVQGMVQRVLAAGKDNPPPTVDAYDAFVRQWFFEKVVPEYRVKDAKRTALTDGATDSTGTWEVTATVENKGTGRMPVVVAATAGEAYDKEGKPKDGYREERQTIVLGAGESAEVLFQCGFTLPTRPSMRGRRGGPAVAGTPATASAARSRGPASRPCTPSTGRGGCLRRRG